VSKLLVREKADTRDSKGFYLISQSCSAPDMYEFVCRTVEHRRQCIETIRTAIANCPPDHGNIIMGLIIIIVITRRRTGNHVFVQRVSLAVQRYNSVAFKGTFTVPTELH